MAILEEYLAKTPVELHDLIRAIDSLVRAAAPELAPSLKWGNLTYHHKRNICAIVSHGRHVNLQIWGGAGIADPGGLLEGTGKGMRHIRLRPGVDFDQASIGAIVREASKGC